MLLAGSPIYSMNSIHEQYSLNSIHENFRIIQNFYTQTNNFGANPFGKLSDMLSVKALWPLCRSPGLEQNHFSPCTRTSGVQCELHLAFGIEVEPDRAFVTKKRSRWPKVCVWILRVDSVCKFWIRSRACEGTLSACKACVIKDLH